MDAFYNLESELNGFEVYAPEVTGIGEKAFSRSSIKNVIGDNPVKTYPNIIDTIGNEAFEYCQNLKGELTLMARYVDDYAFQQCFNITDLVVDNDMQIQTTIDYCQDVKREQREFLAKAGIKILYDN